ncbi:hypothetical protein HII36_21840 [Nonomuraea sp. NN258]|uniref:hypothetical protein n=1 Tax=Nonomuraea antri TaxID=2730852 RepID=UPI001568F3E9|nr:hypothetical protein [Nonomuraea antri]NRQ34475.1 hypothetical protein [Nonomuraea antri]
MTSRADRIAECSAIMQSEGISSPRALAERLGGVSERSVQRYLRDLEGRCRRTDHYEEWMPLILEHLRRYPRSRFTRCEPARVVMGDRFVTLGSTLRRMEREELVTCTVEPRSDGFFSPEQTVSGGSFIRTSP